MDRVASFYFVLEVTVFYYTPKELSDSAEAGNMTVLTLASAAFFNPSNTL